jgi:hypothetical protein
VKNIVLFLLLPFTSFTQNLAHVASSGSCLQVPIEVGPLLILNTSTDKLSLCFTASDTQACIELSGAGWGAATISLGNEAIFLFSNDVTVTVKSIEVQSFYAGSNSYKHRYAINPADVENFSKYNLIGIRKYRFRDFSDLAIPRQKGEAIKNLSAAFLKELSKLSTAKSASL